MSGWLRAKLLRNVEELYVLGSKAAEVDDLSPRDIVGKSLFESGARNHQVLAGGRLMQFVTRDGLVSIKLQAEFQFTRHEHHCHG